MERQFQQPRLRQRSYLLLLLELSISAYLWERILVNLGSPSPRSRTARTVLASSPQRHGKLGPVGLTSPQRCVQMLRTSSYRFPRQPGHDRDRPPPELRRDSSEGTEEVEGISKVGSIFFGMMSVNGSKPRVRSEIVLMKYSKDVKTHHRCKICPNLAAIHLLDHV